MEAPAEAFLDYNCRPLWRWSACGAHYQSQIYIFYCVFFGVHAVSTIGSLAFAVWTFCACCGRRVDRRNRKMSLRVFVCLSIIAFSSCTIYCYFNTSPVGYNVPSALLALWWAVACNALGAAAALVSCTWADALDDRDLAVRSSFLHAYKKHFFLVLGDRCINSLIMVFAGLDLGGASYLILMRVYCAHWCVFAGGLAASMTYYGLKMRSRLLLLGSAAAASRTTRVTVLYAGTAAATCVFAAVQAGIQHVLETSSVAWFIVLCTYHGVVMLLATWFIIGRPNENELTRSTTKSSKTASSRPQLSSPSLSDDFSLE